jgi:MFS family permease
MIHRGIESGTGAAAAAEEAREARNALGLELYQVLVRVGWIFKTETIIMPAVLDAVVDSGTLRGLLPVLNRTGQSVPPLLAAGIVGRMPRKKWALVATTLAMGLCFACLAAAWSALAAGSPARLAGVFLVIYAIFSATVGLNQLVFAALMGKLIPAGRRGRALVVSVTAGSVVAIAAAVALLGPWLALADGFPRIFAATAAFFGAAAAVPLLLDEPADGPADGPGAAAVDRRRGAWRGLRAGIDAWRRTLAADPALVRLCAVAACFAAVLMLFPHYQAFARDRLGSRPASMLTWVVVQNAATGAVSVFAGPLADRRGTRIVLAWLVGLSALAPLTVTLLSLLPGRLAVDWFWLVYVPLGINPIALKMFTNYGLELAATAADHARYVSVVGAALAAPFVISPLVGLAVDRLGSRPVFLAGAAVIVAGAAIAGRLPEPRERRGGG